MDWPESCSGQVCSCPVESRPAIKQKFYCESERFYLLTFQPELDPLFQKLNHSFHHPRALRCDLVSPASHTPVHSRARRNAGRALAGRRGRWCGRTSDPPRGFPHVIPASHWTSSWAPAGVTPGAMPARHRGRHACLAGRVGDHVPRKQIR
jgi:hypothetical protein